MHHGFTRGSMLIIVVRIPALDAAVANLHQHWPCCSHTRVVRKAATACTVSCRLELTGALDAWLLSPQTGAVPRSQAWPGVSSSFFPASFDLQPPTFALAACSASNISFLVGPSLLFALYFCLSCMTALLVLHTPFVYLRCLPRPRCSLRVPIPRHTGHTRYQSSRLAALILHDRLHSDSFRTDRPRRITHRPTSFLLVRSAMN
jgi:hypothetical protein